ncbi:MAG: GrpB family protein [Elusimicrobiota bacterium]
MKASDKHVDVQEYDPAWPSRFDEERAGLLRLGNDRIAGVEHIGSTAIPGLAAKPIIDVMVGVPELLIDARLLSDLAGFGYEYFGEYGIPGRHFFRKGDPRTHHLHWVRSGGDFWEEHLLFRDYLRRHLDEARRYEELKRGLALRYAEDRDSYTASKTGFIQEVLARARRWKAGAA